MPVSNWRFGLCVDHDNILFYNEQKN